MTRFLQPVVAAALAVGCAGSEARPTSAAKTSDDEERAGPHRSTAPEVEEAPDDGVEIEGLRGHLEPYKIAEGVKPKQQALSSCYHDELKRHRFLGGAVELSFVVARDGAVSAVRLSKSDLGSWAVEACLLDTARSMRFARPKGNGEADFTLPLDFQSGRGSVIWWAEERADAEVEVNVATFDACSEEHGGGPANVWVTLYVGARGEVKSVGFASPDRTIDRDWAACASAAATAWVLSDPRGKIAKAGFRYRPE